MNRSRTLPCAILSLLAFAACAGTLPPPLPPPALGAAPSEPEARSPAAGKPSAPLRPAAAASDSVAPPTAEAGADLGAGTGAEPDPNADWSAFLASDPITSSTEATRPDIAERVEWWIDRWQTGGREAFLRGLGRLGRYEAFVSAELAERGLPASLLYLPLIEANYYPEALSPVGAGGLWQFMPVTGRERGLRIDALVDERFDAVVATPQALDLLAELRDRFGSWFLALAAYNGGPTRVRRLIRAHGGGAPADDAMFARIRAALPRETSDFIPKYLAAVRVASNPERFGLGGYVREEARRSVTVEIEGAATLDVIAQVAQADHEDVADLNPQLLRQMTPPAGSTRVHLPPWVSPAAFAERLAEIPPHRRVTTHIVAAGETLSHIALRYEVSVAELMEANPRVEPRRMRVGTVLTVPTGLGVG